jgi:hypothetical protein
MQSLTNWNTFLKLWAYFTAFDITIYTNKLEDDKCLDIGDYDIIIKEKVNEV